MLNKKLLQTAALMLAVMTTAPAAATESNRFINRDAEGWFWYASEPVEEELPEEPEAPPEPVAETPEHTPVEQPEHKPQAPTVLSTKWLRENINKYLDAAIDDPTIENVQAFLYLQRLSMDMSEQFADVAEMAVSGNPMLDEMTRRPTSTFGTQKVDVVAGRLKESLIQEITNRAGVFFFYGRNDEYSLAQAPLIQILGRSGFAVIAISDDGEPIPGFENDFEYRADSGHAEMLGVTTLPAVFLASPEGKFAAVGQGMMSLPDLNNRIILAAKRENWITDDEFNKTKPLTNNDNLAEIIGSRNRLAVSLKGEENNDNFVSPEQLMRFIQAKTKGTKNIYE